MMVDKFYMEHDLSIWVFVVGISVYMSLIIGGGMSCMLMTLLLQSWLGEFTYNEFFMILFPSVILSILWMCVSNMYLLVVRGKPKFVIKMNQIMIGIQFLIYVLVLLFFDHEKKWLALSFAIFPLIAYRLMASAKYQTLLVYYESLKQDPEGFRRHFFESLQK